MKKWKRCFCKVCGKVTVHVTAIIGFPFHYREPHPDDGVACASCGVALPMAVKIVKGLGAQKVFCKKCRPFKEAERRKWKIKCGSLL